MNEPGVPQGSRAQRVPYEYIVAFVYCAALFMEIMDTTIVNVALETLAHDLNTTTDSIEWVVLGYLLSLAMWIPASGWLSDRFGTKRTMLVALGVFTGASALCGLATSIEQLVLFRILQGVGGGMLTPVGMTMLFRAFPPERRAKAATVLMIPTVVAPATGPVIGGLLIDRASWHWIFLVNVPLGIVTFAIGAIFLREHRERSESPFDLPGFLLSGIALASLLYTLSEGPIKGWASGTIITSGLVGVTAAALLVWCELRAEHPMLALRLLRRRLFGLTNLTQVFVHASFLGLLFLVALFLQQAHGLSPLETGLTVFPEALGVVVSAQVVGRIYARVGPRRLMGVGLLGSALTMASFSTIDGDTSLWTVRLLMFIAGATVACSFVSLQVATFAAISPADTGRASAIFATFGHAGAAIGVALGATTLTTMLRSPSSDTDEQLFHAFHGAFFVVAALALAGSLTAWRIRDSDAAATLRRGHQSHGTTGRPAIKAASPS